MNREEFLAGERTGSKGPGENQSVLILISLAILIMAGLFLVDPGHGPAGETRISGRLELAGDRGDRSPPQLMVMTHDDAFLVADNEQGRELMSLARLNVEVEGKITVDRFGGKVFHVSTYKVLQ